MGPGMCAARPKPPTEWSVALNQNIVWKTALPNAGQSGIAVQKAPRLLFAGGRGHSRGRRHRRRLCASGIISPSSRASCSLFGRACRPSSVVWESGKTSERARWLWRQRRVVNSGDMIGRKRHGFYVVANRCSRAGPGIDAPISSPSGMCWPFVGGWGVARGLRHNGGFCAKCVLSFRPDFTDAQPTHSTTKRKRPQSTYFTDGAIRPLV